MGTEEGRRTLTAAKPKWKREEPQLSGLPCQQPCASPALVHICLLPPSWASANETCPRSPETHWERGPAQQSCVILSQALTGARGTCLRPGWGPRAQSRGYSLATSRPPPTTFSGSFPPFPRPTSLPLLAVSFNRGCESLDQIHTKNLEAPVDCRPQGLMHFDFIFSYR